MKLGIAVVYMVSERNERLLEIHLDQIEKNTTVPYTIYAAVNAVRPACRTKLQVHPRVKICACEPYVTGSGLLRQDRRQVATRGLAFLDSKYEHSWYLEQLIRMAIEDGVSHIALFHVDSFPIRRGWATELAGRLSDRCVLAGISRDPEFDHKPLTACVFYGRDFYCTYQPRLLLTQEEIDSQDYQRYRQACPHSGGSGVGYGFKVFTEDLTWFPLIRSSTGGDHPLFAGVYADLIFHLMATTVVEEQHAVDFTLRPSQRSGLLGATARVARALLPETLKRRIRWRASPHLKAWCRTGDREAWEQERHRLLDDPDGYLAHLRTGL